MKREEEIRLRADEYAKETWAIGTPYSGFIAGVLWADRHPQWISVADRLPEKGKDVLILKNGTTYDLAQFDNGTFYTERRINGSSDNSTYLNLSYKVANLNVTHWMPLPEPPQTEE